MDASVSGELVCIDRNSLVIVSVSGEYAGEKVECNGDDSGRELSRNVTVTSRITSSDLMKWKIRGRRRRFDGSFAT